VLVLTLPLYFATIFAGLAAVLYGQAWGDGSWPVLGLAMLCTVGCIAAFRREARERRRG
jgi:hypothetical protein